MKVFRLGLALFFVFIILFTGKWLYKAFAQDILRIKITQIWLPLMPSMTPTNSVTNGILQDGIPDKWQYYAWGNATQIYDLDADNVVAGNRAARIERTNTEGGAALMQAFPLDDKNTPPTLFTIYAKGDGGAMHIWYRLNAADDWIKEGGWLGIPPGEDWRQYRLAATIPAEAIEVAVLLQAKGTTEFDEAYLGSNNGTFLSPNLLKNPGFEQDGIEEDPLVWWRNNVLTDMILLSTDSSHSIAYPNTIDMLAGRYGAIQQRAERLNQSCALEPAMTSWLIAKGEQFQAAGGDAAEERLYQAAIQLAPNCPQPYVALADLYKSNFAFKRAADLYRQAAVLSIGTILEGKYSLEEGLLRLRNTGELERAVTSLERAEQITGWEGGGWYEGSAAYYLGVALQELGHFDEARAAFQRTVDCQRCYYHQTAALEALKTLQIGKSD